jgi:copper homeostasis protein
MNVAFSPVLVSKIETAVNMPPLPYVKSPLQRLEVCVDSVESALTAQQAGANAIELCAALVEGGLTPSAGLIHTLMALVQGSAPALFVNVLIRCRAGDFLYSPVEIETMLADVAVCRAAGVHGIVFGALTQDGAVDEPTLERFVAAAHPMRVTFHRAYDMASDPWLALAAVQRCGVHRLLTSGQSASCLDAPALGTKVILPDTCMY